MKKDNIRRAVVALASIAVLTVAGQGAVVEAATQPSLARSGGAQPLAQQDEFVPVTDLEQQEQLPAAPLVMVAYAVAWIAVLLYVWSLWRRLAKVEGEIAALSRRVDPKAQR